MDDNFIGRYRMALERLAAPVPFNIDETLPDVGSEGEVERWIREIKDFAVSDCELRRDSPG